MSSGVVSGAADRASQENGAPRMDAVGAARLHQSFRRRLAERCDGEQALRVLREMMLAAPDAPTYAQRRAAFLRILRENTPPSGFTARILRFFAVDAPEFAFDDRDRLVHAVLEHSEDYEALVLFLLAMTEQADCVRPIFDRIAASDRAFTILSKLLTAPWLESYRHILAAKLVGAARTRPGAFRVWVRDDPDTVFQPEVFDLLLQQGTHALSGVCKEFLINGPEQHRVRFIAALENDGTEKALRLLILGLPFGSRPAEPSLLAAIAAFDHDLAVAALREVVHCGNLRDERTDDAVRAIRVLHSMDNEESREFVDEVAYGRTALLHSYRKELRRGAAALLKDGHGL